MTDYNVEWILGDNPYYPQIPDISDVKWPKGWVPPRVGDTISDVGLDGIVQAVEWGVGWNPTVTITLGIDYVTPSRLPEKQY